MVKQMMITAACHLWSPCALDTVSHGCQLYLVQSKYSGEKEIFVTVNHLYLLQTQGTNAEDHCGVERT